MIKRNFDIIIVGAGVSGLILADEITKRTNKKVLLLEKEKKLKFEKNLCFWNHPYNILNKSADNKWKKVCVIIKGKKHSLNFSGIEYLRIKSKNLYNFFLSRLKKRKNFKIIMGVKIKSLKSNNNIVELNTENKIYNSQLLFDSRIDNNVEKSHRLLQHFYGVEITFKENIINKDEVILMDIQNKKNNFNFIYVLPFSQNKILVETTYFSKRTLSRSKYKQDIEMYMSRNYFGKQYKIRFCESGIIPMFRIIEKKMENCIKIGTAGNWVKQSTGYSLQNSFIYSKQIVDCIIKEKYPKIRKNNFLNFLDNTFCKFIENNPETALQFFERFFKRNSLPIIVKFLTNTANLFETLKIIISLPKISLIKSVFEIR